ncbi:Vacuolar basic amino acid transporter 5 [Candida viswanathii]|uniref:Vacuolar basic amino acid transporter 5 n=1 Tax=Candida viswanathii TaxID=5486 RepID=A0A367YIF3_9ASCO|nr:Vacuolar basic amino acid transporter 5 [Candida viswanathii]
MALPELVPEPTNMSDPFKSPERNPFESPNQNPYSKDEVWSPTSSKYPDNATTNYSPETSNSRFAQTPNTLAPEQTPNNNTNNNDGHYVEADAGDGTKAHEQYLTGVPLFLTIASCIVSLFLVALDQTVVSTILTKVGDKFKAFEKIGWLTSGFMLPMACLVPSYGNISIAFGRKWTLVAGIVIFEIGSLVSGVSNSMSLLIGGRVIQGIGGGAIQAIVMVILTEVVPMSKRSLVFASISVVYSTSSVLGPIIGGGLEKISWRWCFYINLPIGGVALAVLMFGFHPPKTKGNMKEKLSQIDFVGFVLLTSGLVVLLLALTFGGVNYPWSSGSIAALFTVGSVLLLLFVIWNFRYSDNPIILAEFLKNWRVLMACLAGMFNFAFFISNLTYLAVYFQVIFNHGSLQSGIDLLPLVISVTLASLANSFFIDFTKNVKITMIVSGVLSPVGTGLILLFGTSRQVGLNIGVLIVSGISIGLQFQSSLLSAQLAVPKDIPGATILVTVFLDFLKNIASTIAVTLSQLLYQTTGQNNINNLLKNLPEDSQEYADLKNYSASSLISNPELVQKLPDSTRRLVLDQLMKGLKNVFYLGLAFAICCFVTSIFTTNQKIPRSSEIKRKDESEEEKSQ